MRVRTPTDWKHRDLGRFARRVVITAWLLALSVVDYAREPSPWVYVSGLLGFLGALFVASIAAYEWAKPVRDRESA